MHKLNEEDFQLSEIVLNDKFIDDEKEIIVRNLMKDINLNIFLSVKENKRISSVEIAELFNIEHYNILAKIRGIIETFNSDLVNKNIFKSNYISQQNKTIECFELTEVGFLLITMYIYSKRVILYKEAIVRLFFSYRYISIYLEDNLNIDFSNRVDIVDRKFRYIMIDERLALVESTHVADVFRKQHKHVLEAIREIKNRCSEQLGALSFRPTARKWSQITPTGGKAEYTEEMYLISEIGFNMILSVITSDNKYIEFTKHQFMEDFHKFTNSLNQLNSFSRVMTPVMYKEKQKMIKETAQFFHLSIKLIVNGEWENTYKKFPGLNDDFNDFVKNYSKKFDNINYFFISDICEKVFYMKGEFKDKNGKAFILNQYLEHRGVLDINTKNKSGNRLPNWFYLQTGLFIVNNNATRNNAYDYYMASELAVKVLFFLRKDFGKFVMFKDYFNNMNSHNDIFYKYHLK